MSRIKKRKIQSRFEQFPEPKNMQVNFKELQCRIKPALNYSTYDGRWIDPPFIAQVSLSLIDDRKRCFTVNGFSIRKRKRSGKLYLVGPWKKGFKNSFFPYTNIDNFLWKEIEARVIEQYEYEHPPFVEE